MNAHPYHHPAGRREPPVKRSRHPTGEPECVVEGVRKDTENSPLSGFMKREQHENASIRVIPIFPGRNRGIYEGFVPVNEHIQLISDVYWCEPLRFNEALFHRLSCGQPLSIQGYLSR